MSDPFELDQLKQQILRQQAQAAGRGPALGAPYSREAPANALPPLGDLSFVTPPSALVAMGAPADTAVGLAQAGQGAIVPAGPEGPAGSADYDKALAAIRATLGKGMSDEKWNA